MKIKYLFKRGNSLWSRAPRPGMPRGSCYPMGLYNDVTPKNKALHEKEWERLYLLAFKRNYEPFIGEVSSVPVVPTKPEKYRPLFKDLVQRYLDEHAVLKTSFECIKTQVRPLTAKFGDKFYDEVEKKDVLLWLHDLRNDGEGIAVATWNVLVGYLRRIYKYNLEVDDRLIKTRTVDLICSMKLSQEQPRIRTCAPSMEKQLKYYEWYKEHSPAFAKFYLFRVLTGLRPTETSKLTWDQHEEEIFMEKTLHKFRIPTCRVKNKKLREVYVPDKAWELISLDFRSGLVFTNPKALKKDRSWNEGTWDSWTKQLKRAFPSDPDCRILTKEERRTKDSLVSRTPRTSYATHMLEVEHVDIGTVAVNMGHVNIASTERYRQRNKFNRLKSIYPELTQIQEQSHTESYKHVV